MKRFKLWVGIALTLLTAACYSTAADESTARNSEVFAYPAEWGQVISAEVPILAVRDSLGITRVIRRADGEVVLTIIPMQSPRRIDTVRVAPDGTVVK